MKKVISVIVSVILFLATSLCSAEDDGLIKYLKQTRATLEQKELALKQKELALKEAERVLERKIKKLNALVEELKVYLKSLEKMQSERLRHVVETYEKMSPEDAAIRLEGISEKKATEILLLMKPRKAAMILSNMEPQKAVRLTTKLTELGGFERIKRHLR